MSGIKSFGSITGSISVASTLTGALSIPSCGVIDYDIYEGDYTVIPNDKVQILATANKLLKQDVVVEASEYSIPEGGGLATDGDVDNVIDEVFGTEHEPDDEPTIDSDNIATKEELEDVIEDVFGE